MATTTDGAVSGSVAERFRRADAIFDAALDLPEAEQAAYVVRACGGDAELRAEVLGLLGASQLDGGLLDGAAAPVAAMLGVAGTRAESTVPVRVGPFEVVREIGRGGMGRVFLARRADGQFEQRVALKLLQHASPGLVRRFLEERRILARLEHPAIARLIDGGVAADGLPYFALEYVEGEHIDHYCAVRDLPLDARLALVDAVCDAVSFAHEHLVIHRDLKPSNVLVTPDGQVKLLDFGIAKLLGDRQEDDTRPELRAMAPEFAAPEQVRGAAVSTATDVYSLGVLSSERTARLARPRSSCPALILRSARRAQTRRTAAPPRSGRAMSRDLLPSERRASTHHQLQQRDRHGAGGRPGDRAAPVHVGSDGVGRRVLVGREAPDRGHESLGGRCGQRARGGGDRRPLAAFVSEQSVGQGHVVRILGAVRVGECGCRCSHRVRRARDTPRGAQRLPARWHSGMVCGAREVHPSSPAPPSCAAHRSRF